MRKLMKSKKGFTLVELMIVIVIMAILVAVAVPIYSAVTTNAKKKTCQSNMRIIKENITSFQMTGGADGETLTKEALATAISNNDQTFLNMFEGGKLPACPSDSTKQYSITIEEGTNGALTYKVQCTSGDASTHNATST